MTKKKPKQNPADRTQFSLNLDAPVRDPRLRLTIDDLIATYGRSMTHPDKHPHDGSRPVPPSTLQRALDRRRDNLGNPDPWIPIGKAIRVTRDIPADIYMGGWGDGPAWLRASAQVFLTRRDGHVVEFVSGPRPPGPPGEPRGGGEFPIEFLAFCEDL